MRRGLRVAAIALLFVALAAIGFLAVLAEGYVPKTLRQVLLAALVVGPLLIFGEAILELLLQGVAYAIGRVVLPVVTFGKLRAEKFTEQLCFPWHGLARLPDGALVLSNEGTSVVGLMVLALVAVAGYFVFA